MRLIAFIQEQNGDPVSFMDIQKDCVTKNETGHKSKADSLECDIDVIKNELRQHDALFAFMDENRMALRFSAQNVFDFIEQKVLFNIHMDMLFR